MKFFLGFFLASLAVASGGPWGTDCGPLDRLINNCPQNKVADPLPTAPPPSVLQAASGLLASNKGTSTKTNKSTASPAECMSITCGDVPCPSPGQWITKEGQCCPLCWFPKIAYQRIVVGATHTDGPAKGAPLPECNNVICPSVDSLCVNPTLEEKRCCESCA
uniref:Uncharacterized protein n=1 Tax=Chromera velia CCMP2878 TaxID=1169474 RepID=A0A0G4FB58_9ALVE|mmetsp:Transcript_41464/g.81807  ORF Transcript_41464/g.81807 Transcript_41464/m.81807 type:complete len:163 (-) Transcript_41464:243-731(-)|eukprot:Cvel_16105.t1-p1 / transcript=Cvel_16105.t1 / gene=Cvel_16105 / organism=Chromera_velia_CCMP2878 / gene_product=hypothetical protein / transcript_product=hypothetical protein / location=Cvel_scaffold1225:47516-50464(+) / protein_length=162 / sequence_SO=supercontig / SO=protein_coding / is_pseudo=false